MQCEKECHVGCLKDHNMEDLRKEYPRPRLWLALLCCTNSQLSQLECLIYLGRKWLSFDPLVATNTDYQGQGYFRSLFSSIESLLGSLNVRNIVLAAADDEAESV